MNYKIKITLLSYFLLAIICWSCQQEGQKSGDRALEALPVNATVVTAFDVPTLMEKANFEAIQQMEFYRFFAEKAQEESDILATVFANPENAGIDLTKKAYLSIELNPDNPEEIYTGIIFNLASSEDFSAFANSFRDSRLSKRTNYQIADLNESTQLAWNDQVGIIALGEGIYETEEVVNAFFAPSTENSLSNNERLNNLLAEKHDITTWLTSNALAQNNNAKLVLSLAKIKPTALQDNFIHGYLDFNEGQVDAKLDYFFQEELIQDVNLLFKENVETDFSQYIAGKNLNIYLTAALDFEGLHTALSKRPQVKMFADFALKGYGLSIEKLQDALDGDLVFATYTGNVNNRQEGLFAMKLNDVAQFKAFLAAAEELEFVTETAKGRYLIAPSFNKLLSSIVPFDLGSAFDNQLMITDDIAFLSGNIDRLDAIEYATLSPTNQIPANLKKLANQHPLALLIDFNSYKRIGIPGGEDLDLLELFGNKKAADLQLTMKNQEVNSLQAIFEAVNKEFLKNKEQKQPVSQEKS